MSGVVPAIDWPAGGLVPVVIVDDRNEAVLTLAYANSEALERTVRTRSTWLFSRSRNELWNKGATSGNTQEVVAVAVDCDRDALIYRVIPSGPACHTGAQACFGPAVQLAASSASNGASPPNSATPLSAAGSSAKGAQPQSAGFVAAVSELAATIAQRKREPSADSYTARLFAGGVDRIGKKIGEEATEVVIAAKNDDRNELIWETADLLYHTLVMLAAREIDLDEVGAELARRATPTG